MCLGRTIRPGAASFCRPFPRRGRRPVSFRKIRRGTCPQRPAPVGGDRSPRGKTARKGGVRQTAFPDEDPLSSPVGIRQRKERPVVALEGVFCRCRRMSLSGSRRSGGVHVGEAGRATLRGGWRRSGRDGRRRGRGAVRLSAKGLLCRDDRRPRFAAGGDVPGTRFRRRDA